MFQRIARQALEIGLDERPAEIQEARCQPDSAGNVTISLRVIVHHFSRIEIRSQWLHQLPPGHRQFLSVRNCKGEVISERLLNAKSDSVSLQAGDVVAAASAARATMSFGGFVMMGVKHIVSGHDHLLFLFSLLLVSRNFGSTLKIITCFTVAHSITLALAALGIVQIPSRVIEPVIAASILYVGIENLIQGEAPKGRSMLTFGFGLVHGLGFASALRELGIGSTGAEIAGPLFSFNLGVELGQVSIAALFLPLLWTVNERPFFARRCVPLCSALAVLIGTYWLIQRVVLSGRS